MSINTQINKLLPFTNLLIQKQIFAQNIFPSPGHDRNYVYLNFHYAMFNLKITEITDFKVYFSACKICQTLIGLKCLNLKIGKRN